ncbi:chemotaxis protein [Maridesulfovibrio bastinii]|uniref:chemotaxis protein n=1 Tax=Maridesulfovibrio bastinii TaxID=47157 RepID=UPI000408D540|nr:chemotaxis protein [Maridesulfovibrio bastinii]
MAGSNILLKAGTNEVEILELYLDEGMGDKYKRWSFGLNVAKVKKIMRDSDLKNFSGTNKNTQRLQNAQVDITNPLVIGMFEFMGRVIPLMDLCGWLKLRETDSSKRMIVVTEFNDTVSAFMVSGVNRIHRISWSDLEALSGRMAEYAEGTIIGTVKLTDPDRIMQILDLEQAMDDLCPSKSIKNLEDVVKVDHAVYNAICADDSRSMRNLVKGALEKGGFSVSAYANGQETWDALLELKEKAVARNVPITDLLQLVVSDIEMPVMDGHALTRKIKNDEVLKKLTVYLFSSLITEELRHKGLSVGADRQYSKPQIATLVETAIQEAGELE